MTAQRSDVKLMSGGTLVLLLLIAAGAAAALYRLSAGLGAATNLSDSYPWGLWIGMDVMVGVALAAGGFVIAAGVYIFNMKQYRAVARPAVLTAFLGYLMVMLGLFLDIGKPFSFWHPIVMWQPHSVMFEVVWCVLLYATVLFLELTLHRSKVLLLPLVIAGITLSYGHQSSLGALFLLNEAELSGLWWSTMMNNLFFLSAIAAGLAMVSFETIVSHNVFKKEHNMAVLSGLARGTAVALLVYLVVRFVDLARLGNLGLIFGGGRESMLFILEIAGGVILPMLLLFSRGVRESVSGILWSQVLVLAGVLLNRFNVLFFAQSGAGGSYFPSLMEILVTLGLISLGVFLYRWVMLTVPSFAAAEGD